MVRKGGGKKDKGRTGVGYSEIERSFEDRCRQYSARRWCEEDLISG